MTVFPFIVWLYFSIARPEVGSQDLNAQRVVLLNLIDDMPEPKDWLQEWIFNLAKNRLQKEVASVTALLEAGVGEVAFMHFD